ncbi:MAG: YibE/F family protein [Ruminococcaceae bacterium]|nr:YibE/F family protein [Oscillospiraceae bacterium]
MSKSENESENIIMKTKNWKGIFTYLFVTLIAVVYTIVGNKICSTDFKEQTDMDFYRAKVTVVGDSITDSFSINDGASWIENKVIPFSVELTSGPYKGKSVEVTQPIDSIYMNPSKEVEEGDNIIVANKAGMGSSTGEWIFIEHNRSNYLIILCLVFLLLIVLIGRFKGLATILSLLFTGSAIFLVYIPSILKGYNIYVSTIINCVFIIMVSLSLLNGINKKTLCAILGNIGGVAVSGILTLIMNKLLNITGFVDEDYTFLACLETDVPINLKAVIWGGVVIGSLGAIMDVAMSIASAMNELSAHMQKKSFSRMLKSGMNIGKDAIGTMTNTLILAYIGGSLAMVLLLTAYNRNVLYLFNLERIAVEVVQAVVGSIGILFAVPATAAFSAYIFNRDSKFIILKTDNP